VKTSSELRKTGHGDDLQRAPHDDLLRRQTFYRRQLFYGTKVLDGRLLSLGRRFRHAPIDAHWLPEKSWCQGEDSMESPEQLRAKAAKAREVASGKNRSPNGYLLELADRYEAEATELERRRPTARS
jgi:hypothetical protein